MGFDPCNRSLKIQESIKTLISKVGTHLGVWRFIASHSPALPGVWNVILGLHYWPTLSQTLALVASPRLGLQHFYYWRNWLMFKKIVENMMLLKELDVVQDLWWRPIIIEEIQHCSKHRLKTCYCYKILLWTCCWRNLQFKIPILFYTFIATQNVGGLWICLHSSLWSSFEVKLFVSSSSMVLKDLALLYNF
jgi:hypothetical protein